ncbi:MAG: hypothetical protein ABJE47_08915 [bacterium]
MNTETPVKATTPASLVGTMKDPIVGEYATDLRAGIRTMASEMQSSRTPLSESGRRINGQIASLLLVGFLIAAGVIWWKYSAGAESFRQGIVAGGAAAKTK